STRTRPSAPSSSRGRTEQTRQVPGTGRGADGHTYDSRVNFELSPEQREIQTLTREFAQREIEPYASEWDRNKTFPREVFSKLAELGLMGACVPEEYGGAG